MRVVLITRIHETCPYVVQVYISGFSETRDNVIFALAESHAVPRAERKCSYRCHNTLDENVLRKKIVFGGEKGKIAQFSVLCRMHESRTCAHVYEISVGIIITFRLPEITVAIFS